MGRSLFCNVFFCEMLLSRPRIRVKIRAGSRNKGVCRMQTAEKR